MRLKFQLGDGRTSKKSHIHYVSIYEGQPVICCAEYSRQLYAEHFLLCPSKSCKGHPFIIDAEAKKERS